MTGEDSWPCKVRTVPTPDIVTPAVRKWFCQLVLHNGVANIPTIPFLPLPLQESSFKKFRSALPKEDRPPMPLWPAVRPPGRSASQEGGRHKRSKTTASSAIETALGDVSAATGDVDLNIVKTEPVESEVKLGTSPAENKDASRSRSHERAGRKRRAVSTSLPAAKRHALELVKKLWSMEDDVKKEPVEVISVDSSDEE